MLLPKCSKERLVQAGLRGMKVTPALAIFFLTQPRESVAGFLREAPRLVAGFKLPRAARVVRRRRVR
jgi:hypothetical protein